jgi:hypothetical protein
MGVDQRLQLHQPVKCAEGSLSLQHYGLGRWVVDLSWWRGVTTKFTGDRWEVPQREFEQREIISKQFCRGQMAGGDVSGIGSGGGTFVADPVGEAAMGVELGNGGAGTLFGRGVETADVSVAREVGR